MRTGIFWISFIQAFYMNGPDGQFLRTALACQGFDVFYMLVLG